MREVSMNRLNDLPLRGGGSVIEKEHLVAGQAFPFDEVPFCWISNRWMRLKSQWLSSPPNSKDHASNDHTFPWRESISTPFSKIFIRWQWQFISGNSQNQSRTTSARNAISRKWRFRILRFSKSRQQRLLTIPWKIKIISRNFVSKAVNFRDSMYRHRNQFCASIYSTILLLVYESQTRSRMSQKEVILKVNSRSLPGWSLSNLRFLVLYYQDNSKFCRRKSFDRVWSRSSPR